MKAVMIDTNIRWSSQMDSLCRALGMDPDKPAQRGRVFEAFMTFMTRWAGDQSTDSGIFWGISLAEMGRWAGWHEPLRFGRALVKAGFVVSLTEKYPESLLRGRTGFVVWGALDISWRSIHSQRADRAELMLFLADKLRRSEQALREGIPPGRYGDWLYTAEEIKNRRQGRDGDDEPGLTSADAPDPVAPPPRMAPCVSQRPPPPLRSETYVQNVKEENATQRTDVRSERPPTGKRPSREQFEALRAARNDGDPARALALLDDSPYAQRLADEAVLRAPSFVLDAIGELVETWQAYRAVRWPPALVFKRITAHLRTLTDGHEAGRGQEGAGGVGTGKIGFHSTLAAASAADSPKAIRAAIQAMPRPGGAFPGRLGC